MSKLNVSDVFPNYTVDTAYKTDLKLYDLLSDKTVIWFLRYIGCTVCHYDVQVAANRYNELKEAGADVIFVMQSDQAHLVNDYPEGSLPFEIIANPTQSIYKDLEILPAESKEQMVGNVLDKLKEKGGKAAAMGFSHGDYEGDEMQLPAMFIVNKKGEVQFAKYAENIVDLPDFDEVLNLVK